MVKVATRAQAPKDLSPNWNGHETLTAEQFASKFRDSMSYYRLEFSGKDLKPAVVKWMQTASWDKADVEAFKRTKDGRCGVTMGALASNLLRGMPAVRADFNQGRDATVWLREQIIAVIDAGKNDIEEIAAEEVKPLVAQPTIQERMRETAGKMVEEIEDAIEGFQADPENFDPKAFKILNLLKGKEVKAAHARVIKGFYSRDLDELLESSSDGADEQLKEGYSHLSKKQIRNLAMFYQEVISACDMLSQEAKVNRKPSARKSVSKDKLVAKLKYKKTDEPTKLVSINPTDIIGSKELWIYNTKTRKLGRYVASEFNDLGVKGTTITGFSEHQSICKTLRKPEETLKEFKAAGKVQLRKFLDGINTTDTKMNGRINEETVLLKVQ